MISHVQMAHPRHLPIEITLRDEISIFLRLERFLKIAILLKDPLLTMILCAPNEKQDKENLGQKRLSDNTKVDFGATKDHG